MLGPLVTQVVMRQAINDARSLAPSQSCLMSSARVARCAAFATAATLVATTQEKEQFFSALLRSPGKSQDPAGETILLSAAYCVELITRRLSTIGSWHMQVSELVCMAARASCLEGIENSCRSCSASMREAIRPMLNQHALSRITSLTRTSPASSCGTLSHVL